MEAATTLSQHVGLSQACQGLGVPRSSYYHAQQPKPEATMRPKPKRALSDAEKIKLRDLLNSDRFCDRSPRQIYATLLDEGVTCVTGARCIGFWPKSTRFESGVMCFVTLTTRSRSFLPGVRMSFGRGI